VCNPEGIIYDGDSSNPLQNVSIDVDKNNGTVRYMLGNDVKYEGHVKGLIDFYSDISRARVGDSVQHPKKISLKEGDTKTLYWVGNQHDSYRIKITVKANYYR